MRPLLFVVCLIGLTLSTQAEVYKWVDAQGKTHFSDTPPPSMRKQQTPSAQVRLPELNNMKAPSYTPSDVPPSVVLYSTAWCGYCTKARRYFKQQKIRFKEKDIEKSQRARKEYDRLQGRGVPLILVGKQKIQGFDLAKFEAAYY